MSIKYNLVKLAEKITGRKCCRCHFNVAGRCCHPNGETFCRCWQSITRPGFEYSPSVEGYNDAAAAAAGVKAGLEPGDMTPEEKYELGKIVESLQEASATARDGGLLEDDEMASDWFEG